MFALKTIGEMSAAFSCPSWLMQSDLVLVHAGDLNLEDNLTLDWEAGWDDGGIVVTLSVLSHKGPLQDLAAGASIRGLCIGGDLHMARLACVPQPVGSGSPVSLASLTCFHSRACASTRSTPSASCACLGPSTWKLARPTPSICQNLSHSSA